MDTKASPSKEEGSSDDEQEAIFAKIQKSAPEWFTEAFTFIISTIKMETHSASVVGKSFGLVGIDIECKNISISGDIGGFILSTK